MEQKIRAVLQKMQVILDADQLKELNISMQMIFTGCDIVEKRSELISMNNRWTVDLDDFILSKELEGRSKNTIKRYRYELYRLLSYINKAVMDITESDISNYMRAYKTIRNISNQTLKNIRAVFSSFFVWLRDHGRIPTNPIALVENIKVEQKIRKPYTDEERELLLRKCKTLRDKAIMEFLYSTAVRVSELTLLNREDMQFITKDVVVFGKGSKERTVYLNDRTNLYMREYLTSRVDDNPALFVSQNKPYGRLSKAGIEDIIARTGRRAGVQKAHPHRFRRTSITNALNRGMPLQEAMLLAGHAKPETTMRYCTVDQAGVKYHHQKYLSA